jgi:hypothetical protein
MALNKSKKDIIEKITSLHRNIDIYDPYYDWSDYYDYYDYDSYEDYIEYDLISNLNQVDNLLLSTSILWRKYNLDESEFKRLFNCHIIDMDSIYHISKRREMKIDRILGILDDIPDFSNKIENFIK